MTLRSDLSLLRRSSWVLARLLPGLDARCLLDEIADRSTAEPDSRREADHQRAHAAALAGDPEVVCVPAVAGQVAGVLVELLFSSPARVGLLHADPHPGNVLVPRDGHVGLVDFGAVAELPDGVPDRPVRGCAEAWVAGFVDPVTDWPAVPR